MASLSLPFLQGAAVSTSVIEAVTHVLSKTAPKMTLVPVSVHRDPAGARALLSSSNKTVLGASLTSDEIASLGCFHSTLSHTSNAFIKGTNPEYTNVVDLCLVRALVTDAEPCALRYRDRIDSLIGFNLGKEIEHVRHCMERAVQTAILEAKLHKADTITLVLKSVSKHERINSLFQEIAQGACSSAGINLTTANTSNIHNKVVMFPESLKVLLANDVPASDLLEGLVLGISGGAGLTYQQIVGDGVNGFIGSSHENPLSTLAAACEAMKHLGLKEESEGTIKVLRGAVAKEANKTKDLGGKLSPLEFAKVCIA